MDYQLLADMLFPDVKGSVEDILKKYPKRELKENQQVTRYAPSPTGFMHIGNFLQMFLSYSIARMSDGIFYVRAEDNDAKRTVEGALEMIYGLLEDYDIKPDEYQTLQGEDIGAYGPYFQSQRGEIYQTFAKYLVSIGKAFPCFCKKTEGKEDVLKLREEKFSKDDEKEYDPCRKSSALTSLSE